MIVWLVCAQALAEHMAAGADIRYGAVVEKIQWGASGVELRCADGRSFQADAAVVTVSLGVLKVAFILFTFTFNDA